MRLVMDDLSLFYYSLCLASFTEIALRFGIGFSALLPSPGTVERFSELSHSFAGYLIADQPVLLP